MTPVTPIPDGSVIITPTQMYEEQRATYNVVRDISSKIDLSLQRTASLEEDVTALKADVEMLKKNRWPLPSLAAMTGVGALAVAVWQASGR